MQQKSINIIDSLTQIIDRYQFFIVDIWGVLHDGSRLYPAVIQTLKYLQQQQKIVCLLSNAPRKKQIVVNVLQQMGIDSNLYQTILTSGEAVYLDLQHNQQNNFSHFGKNYFYLGPPKDQDLLQGLSYVNTNLQQASFVLNTGFDDNETLLQKIPLLQQAKSLDLPMICANPDLLVVKQDGSKFNCAGIMAKYYQDLGGKVVYYGKPYNKIYEILYNEIKKPAKSSIVAIGDGFETDIAGANNFGIDSILITGGILTHELKISFSQQVDIDKIKKLCQKYMSTPNYTITNFKI